MVNAREWLSGMYASVWHVNLMSDLNLPRVSSQFSGNLGQVCSCNFSIYYFQIAKDCRISGVAFKNE